MKKVLSFTITLFYLLSLTHTGFSQGHLFADGTVIALQSDTDKWLARCFNCQNTVNDKYLDTATIHVGDVDASLPNFARFTVVDVGGGKIALRADNKKFLARCRNCIVGGSYPDFAAIHVTDPSAGYAQFTPERLPNGKYTLRADTGKYLGRCENCSSSPAPRDVATMHETNRDVTTAQWRIVRLNIPDRMDEPYGSRYLNYTGSIIWTTQYGVHSPPGWSTDLYPKFIEDVNGDGMADAVVYGQPGTYVSLSDGQQFMIWHRAISHFGTDQGWEVAKHPRFVTDVNGDGRKDLVGYGNEGVYAALYSGTGNAPAFSDYGLWSDQFGASQKSGFYLNQDFIRTLKDMNRDGRSDVVVFAEEGIHVALSNGAGFDAPTLWVNHFGTNKGWNNSGHVREITDVNGDGYPDVVGYVNSDVLVSINLSGTRLSQPTPWTSEYSHFDAYGYPIRREEMILTTGDANGDGYSDLIVFADEGVDVALSTGTSFRPGSQWVTDYGTRTWRSNTLYKRVVSDVNGDRKADIVGFSHTGTFFSMSEGTRFSAAQKWVAGFGYKEGWYDDNRKPRFIRDVNGDGVQDLVGYGSFGVYVAASAPLYCCDRTYFYDRESGVNVIGGYMARVHLPAAYSSIVMPERDPDICDTAPFLDNYRAIGPNQGAKRSWLNTSWRTELGARFAVNANFFYKWRSPSYFECGYGLGTSISNGRLQSPDATFEGNQTSTLVIYNPTTAKSTGIHAEIVPGSQVSSFSKGSVQFAFSGMELVRDGVPMPSQPDPDTGRARAVVGITRDGKTLIFVIQNNGHDRGGPRNERASLRGMATALIQLGAYTGINLDGAGSAQFWFKNNRSEFKSLPSDPDGLYRGVPIAFGIK